MAKANPSPQSQAPFHRFGPFRISANLMSPIVPGQPLTLSWNTDSNGVAYELGVVTVTLYLVDAYGNPDPMGKLYEKTFSRADSQQIGRGPFSYGPVAIEPEEDLANRIYRIGSHSVVLLLSATAAAPFISGNQLGVARSIEVQRELLDDTWWMWGVPAFRTAMWKTENYSVQGDFVNQSDFSSKTLTATLVELPDDAGASEIDKGSFIPDGLVALRQDVAVSFGMTDLSKNWSWFLGGVFIVDGPQVKTYSYRVRMDVADQFRNAYSVFFSQPVTVRVEVSQLKLAALESAVFLEVAAIAALIAAAAAACTIAGPILTGVAGGLEGGAMAAGKVAGDPPFPDPRFRDIFEPSPRALPDDPELRPVIAFLRAAISIVAHVEALGETDSRLFGAHAAGERRFVKLQNDHFSLLCAQLTKLSRTVKRLSPLAIEFFENHKTFNSAALQEGLEQWRRDSRFRERLRKDYAEVGGLDEEFLALNELLTMPQFIAADIAMPRLMYGVGEAAATLAKIGAAQRPTPYKDLGIAMKRVKPKAARRPKR